MISRKNVFLLGKRKRKAAENVKKRMKTDWDELGSSSEEDEKNTQEAKEARSGGEEGKPKTFAIFHYLLLLPVPFIKASVAATFQ